MRIRSKGGAVRTLLKVALGGWAGFAALNAQAAEMQDLAAAFGNTILATYPDGRHQRIWLQEDGHYEAIGRRGTTSSGKWTLKKDKVCLRQSRPLPVPISYCCEFPVGGDVGVSWLSKDMAGIPIRLTLVKGVQRPVDGPGS